MDLFTPLQIRKISKEIALPAGMRNEPNYLSGQNLVDFFSEFGFEDNYCAPSIGIATKDIGESISRQRYALERLNKLNQMGRIPDVIALFLRTVQEPVVAQRKFQEILHHPIPHIDLSANKMNHMTEKNSSSESSTQTGYTQFYGITKESIVVFISYAWDNEEHKKWVRKLSDDLRANGIYTLLDVYNPGGTCLLDFMQMGIKIARRVLVIGTPGYKEKLNNPSGVAFEGSIMTIEMFNGVKEKYIPILRKGTFKTSFSELMSVQICYDFSDDTQYETQLMKLVADLKGNPLNAAPVVAEEHTMASPTIKGENREWEKVCHYEILTQDEIEGAYNAALEILNKPKMLELFELAKLVFMLCKFDNDGVILSEEQYLLMEKAVEAKFNEASSFDELHEMKIKFYQTMDALNYKNVSYASLSRLLAYLRSLLGRLESEKKWLMVLFLEQLSEENSKQLKHLHDTAPDNGTPYSSMPLFDRVNVDQMFNSIIRTTPTALLNLRMFLEDRYKLAYSLTTDNNSLEYNDDIYNLSVLKAKLNDHMSTLYPIAKLAYVDLLDRIEKSIMRCKGDRNVLVY